MLQYSYYDQTTYFECSIFLPLVYLLSQNSILSTTTFKIIILFCLSSFFTQIINKSINLNLINLMFDRVYKAIKIDNEDPFYRKYVVEADGTFKKFRAESKPKEAKEQPTKAMQKPFQNNSSKKQPQKLSLPITLPPQQQQQPSTKQSRKQKKEQKQLVDQFKNILLQQQELKKYNKKVNSKSNRKFQEYINNHTNSNSKNQPIDSDQAGDYQQSKPQKLYETYLDEKVIVESRNRDEKKYYLGEVVINQKCKWFARIISQELPGYNLLAERQYMNRVMHQSFVYFQILQKKSEQKQKSCNMSPIKNGEESGHQSSFEQEQQLEQLSKKTQCKIVAIKSHVFQQKQIIGKVFLKRSKGTEKYILDPICEKYPKFEVIKHPFSNRKNRKEIDNQYFTAKFVSWTEFEKFPSCNVIAEFGEIGQIEVETKALLQIHNIYQQDFTQQTTQFLKKFTQNLTPEGQYIIPPGEYKTRYDLRDKLIYTIDPKTARDFDDALSVELLDLQTQKKYNLQNPNNKKIYEVGIHIADVSYFVPENTPLDEDARKRTTSVYLVHRVLPMLPRILCETMCSLNPGVQRLTVTVWCYLDEDGNIFEFKRFGRSIIKSKARFSYQIAQGIIQQEIGLGEVPAGFGASNILDQPSLFESIKILNALASKMRENRLKGGSITLQNHKKKFELNNKNWPIKYIIQERKESSFLVQQFMLLANVKVAQILVQNVQEVAVLRRHKFPGEKKIKKFEAFIKTIGLNIEINRETNINQEISNMINNPEIKSSLKKIIKYELMFLLEAAQYFMIDNSKIQSWFHYALNFDCYTHFTSPIRRYPDIIVHRQLIKILEFKDQAIKYIDKAEIESIMRKSNECKTAAKKVSSGCQKIFMCLYLKNHEVFTQGIITSLNHYAINLTIPEYDIRCSIQLKTIKNIKEKEVTQMGTKKILAIKYQSKKQNLNFILKETQQIKLKLAATDHFPIDYSIHLAFPDPKDAEKFIALQ